MTAPRICNGHGATRLPLSSRLWLCLAIVVAGGGHAMATTPRNPERPMNAKTCEEARARLQEAERGSSLVSAERNQEIFELAQAQVARLCGETPKKD